MLNEEHQKALTSLPPSQALQGKLDRRGIANKKILVLTTENDEYLYQNMKTRLACKGCDFIQVFNRRELLSLVRAQSPVVVILSYCGDSAWEILESAREIRQLDKSVLLVMIATQSSEELAIAALKAGINDYYRKDASAEEIEASIECYLADLSVEKDKTPLVDPVSSDQLIGASPSMRAIKTYLAKVASTDSTVLITGETGTGKELVAELIHSNSSRRKKPLVCVNCAALPESLLESELFGHERGAFTGAVVSQIGKFELAEKGTIFLDEIGDMSTHAQAKILRTIESKEVYRLAGKKSIPLNVRVIAATNHDPERLVAEGKFRKDLYFRLNVARLQLPPLRDRKEDIPRLLEHYAGEMNRRFGRTVQGFAEETLAYMLRYDWPGNVRELKNLCEAIFINLSPRSFEITFTDLPEPFQRLLRDSESLVQCEYDRLLSVLLSTKWNVSQAARKLHWSRMTVYRKIEKYHIEKLYAPEEGQEVALPS